MQYTISNLLKNDGAECECKKRHFAGVSDVIIESGAVKRLPELIKKYGGTKAFVLADKNTIKAGASAAEQLKLAGIEHTIYCYNAQPLEPDEWAVGSAVMHYDLSCDIIVGIGSGVINDIGKILAAQTGHNYIIVATAPSMDGYASGTSSMARDGLKVSLPSKCPDAVCADLDILCSAPMRMLCAGVGDMIAKYISICEWRLAHVIVGEYYCEKVADIIRQALDRCVKSAPGLTRREPEAVKAVMEGMVISGIAANYAGISRPASGVEHYFSHVWDMRALEFHTPADLHGIQCAAATLLSLKAYKYVRQLRPDRQKALEYVKNFSFENYCQFLRENMGAGAQSMIDGEYKEHKYDAEKHKKRLDIIIDNWDLICSIIDQELPEYDSVKDLLISIGAPVEPQEFGISRQEIQNAFVITKDIRDKYVVSRLLWDLGEIDNAKQIF